MNQKEANDPLKTLRLEILRTHALLIKKQENRAKAEKIIFKPADRIVIGKEDIVKHAKAREEAYKAHKTWLAAQVRYFDFIEENKIVPW